MGWTYQYREKGISDKDFFSNEFNYSRDGKEGRVIDTSRKGSVVYIAYQSWDGEKDQYGVVALICLTSWNHKEKLNFGYKDMDENMGPIYYDCPKKILDLLTPTEHEYALKWRNKCRDNLKKRERLPKIKEGMILDFEEPLCWNGGIGEWKTFITEKYGKRSWGFRGYQGGCTVTQLLRITKMKDRVYVEVPKDRIVIGRASRFEDHRLFEIMDKGPYGNEGIIRNLDTREYLVRSLKENYTDYANGIQEYLIRTLQETQGIMVIQEMGHLWRVEKTTFDGNLALFVNEVYENMGIPVMSMDINILDEDNNSVVFDCEYLYLSDDLANKLADRIQDSDDDWVTICNDLYKIIQEAS